MSVAEAIRQATGKLAKTSSSARLDAELLMAHALKMRRSDMLLRAMDQAEPECFPALVERRARHEPVAYILGEAEFFGRSFAVNAAVLIPRADSECLVEAALENAPQSGRVIDLGTGSGALLLSLMAECEELEGVGIDASEDALEIARGNAERLGFSGRAQMLRRDWAAPLWHKGLGQFELVIANPPYVEEGADLAPDVARFEPGQALFAGPEGLDDYRIIIPQLRDLLSAKGVAIVEIGAGQARQVGQLAQDHGFKVEMRRDLAGRPRVLVLSSVRNGQN